MDSGHTAWMLTASALVLLMTPGLAFFYGGMVRARNVISTLMYSFIAMAVVSIVWVLWGYSLAFGEGSALVGDLGFFGLSGIDVNDVDNGIPTLLFVVFQMMFAIITPALITGAFVERFKFTTYLVFLVVWVTLVYAPVAHWVWGEEGWISEVGDGALDFAGGTVVHINAGVAAVAAALLVGKSDATPAPSPTTYHTSIHRNSAAVVRMVRLQRRLRAGGRRAGCKRLPGHEHGRGGRGADVGGNIPSADGSHERRRGSFRCGGRPGRDYAGLRVRRSVRCARHRRRRRRLLCYIAVYLRTKTQIDDALEVFAVHGVGGIWGAIATGIFAVAAIGGTAGAIEGNGGQIVTQVVAVIATMVYSFVATLIILKVLDLIPGLGLRVSDEAEDTGLDLSAHGERAFVSDGAD